MILICEGDKFVYNYLICFITNYYISTNGASKQMATPQLQMRSMNTNSSIKQSLDLPDSPVPPSPSPSPPKTERSKAVAGMTAFHPHLALSRIFEHVSTAMSRFVQDIQNHQDVPDDQQLVPD